MPLPSSGPISFADLNEELGNASTSQLDMDSAAIEFNLTKPHGMDEFYGLSITTTKPPTTTTTTTSSPFISYVVTYDEFNEETACASFNQFTIFSQCNLITLPGIGQCFLYNTPNVNDPVAPGYYSDVTTGNYYYVENNGLVEEILPCPAPPPPITTTTTAAPTTTTTTAAPTTTTTTAAPTTTTTTAAPTTTTTTTTTAAPFNSYVVTYDEFNEATACADTVEFTVFSQCSPITLPGIGQCFLYNTQNTGDPVSPGYYADVSTNNYYYVESGGLVEEIGSCTPPTTTTTTLPPSIEPWDGSIQQASSIAACNASATNIYGFIGSGVVPEIGDTCFTTTGGGKFLPAGFYFEGGDFASLQIGSSGLVINKVLC